ncbi:MAG TPA: Sir2 family NAD-dependent protein deacetylase, partial [Thermoanaerobaculia bacterium]|nr:Sir2 family NAD-dependent protein deacetylase [Thermoanaerobaculia bacterium]
MSRDAAVVRLSERLRTARRVTVVTGAGVSAASRIPTFRGAGGLWRNYRAEDLATVAAFDRDPRLVWEWYAWRRELVRAARPNRAHQVLAAWSRRFPRFRLITQNVDGLHERAGTENVIRFHGSLWEVSCRDECGRIPSRWPHEKAFDELPPRCS